MSDTPHPKVGSPGSGCAPLEEVPAWRTWVTPKGLTAKPIHRWFVFPHSFTDELVLALTDKWGVKPGDTILDPFVGAGTTLLAARSLGVDAEGVDLSPLAVLISNVKVRTYERRAVVRDWMRIVEHVRRTPEIDVRPTPEFMTRALPGRILGRFLATKAAIEQSDVARTHKEFFLLALLASVRHFSRAVPSGGWVSWVNKRVNSSSVLSHVGGRVTEMLRDVGQRGKGKQRAMVADARDVPYPDGSISAVITSPPYLNRHDYTRVFTPELMLGFLDWNGLRDLRYQSFQSHPEARPVRVRDGYMSPSRLTAIVARLAVLKPDRRIVPMIEGYFLDLYLSLKEMARVCKHGARLAIVIGNVQYLGEQIPVDEFTAELGERVGLKCESIVAARYRGNSAQQMGKFGRKPARESVVLFSKPAQQD